MAKATRNILAAAALALVIAAPEAPADELTEKIQKDLVALGYDPGNINGEVTTETTVAIAKFQADRNMPVIAVAPADELLEGAERKVLEIAQLGMTGQTFTLEQALHEAFDRLDSRHQRDALSISGLPTGYIDLDDKNIAGGRLTDLTLGVNWYLNRYTKFQFNYIHAFLTRPVGVDSDADIVALRAQLDF